ncbi:MAG: hypothetical protein IKJ99_08785 [Oscillospiraceae bacterium]|nr:hypothetical protein [Oscillospiraceae bacterium]
MKRLLLYIMVIGAALLIPEQGTDVGKLQPVELIFLYKDEGEIVLETDTGGMGRGETLAEAYQDLEDTTPGTLFLDTADYLLVARSARTLVPQMAAYMKVNTGVCQAEKGTDLVLAAEYLGVHQPEKTLRTLKETDKLSVLKQEKKDEKIILKIYN